jgi:ArsR family transcriptional regulator, arsenate/arsenite/antimonite-responsive transcriptional repressor
MQTKNAIEALLALGQEARLAAYRLVVKHEPYGLPAGTIAAKLNANPSTMSRHLAQLERAGLLRSWRDGRQIIYAIDHDGTDALLRFLTEDCCTAQPGAAPDRKRPHRRNKNLVTS